MLSKDTHTVYQDTPPTLVSVNTHEAITLVVSGGGLVGAVDWDLVVVGPQAVTMCV